jgi:peroxiredoxin/outer membrane lipoprotein-sorting protein
MFCPHPPLAEGLLSISLFLAFPAALAGGGPPSQAPDQPIAINLIKRVSDNYAQLKSYQLKLTVSTEIKSRTEQKNIESEVEISVSRPGKARIVLSGGLGEMQLFSDGVTTWAFLPLVKQYTRKPGSLEPSDESETSHSSPGFSVLATELRGHYEKLAERVGSAKLLPEDVLNVEGKDIKAAVVEVEQAPRDGETDSRTLRTYWIDPERLLVLKRVRTTAASVDGRDDSLEMKVITTLKWIKLNEPLPAGHFVFKPPGGVQEVADLRPARQRAPEVGMEAADLRLKDSTGQEIHLASLRGNVVLLNFWASWCGPCRLEMPILEKLHREFKGRDLKIFGVNDEDVETIRNYVSEYEYSFPTLVDEQQQAISLYRIRGIPTMVIIDRNGKIAHYRIGLSRESDLRAWIKEAGIE